VISSLCDQEEIKVMRRYVIERDMPEVGALSDEQIRSTAGISNSVLDELGSGIQWIQSYATANRIYCVYLAESVELVRQHARLSGLPASEVNEVAWMMDPTSGNSGRGTTIVNHKQRLVAVR